MRRRSLPQVVIPVPCHVDWNLMTRLDSDGRARFCDSCERPVYDSASMTRDELYDLITRNEGALPCLQLHRRPDGTIVTRDCFAPLIGAGRFVWLKVGLAAAAFWAWALGIRPLARSVSRIEEMSERSTGIDTVRGKLGLVIRPDDEPPFLNRTHLAKLPPIPPRPLAIPGWRPWLPAIDHTEPLHHLKADEEIVNPPQRPRLLRRPWR